MLDIKTVYECNRCLGCKTLHPQVNLINLESPNLEQEAVKFEFYAILLIEDCPDGCYCCGRKYYDYSNATMVFLTPGEIFRMSENNTLPNKGYLLAFHPDLLFHTSLDNPIKNYTFFAYHKEEALHLSQRETAKVTCCLENIETSFTMPSIRTVVPFYPATLNYYWIIVHAIMSDSSLPGKIRTRLSWRNWKGSSTSISFPVN